MLLYHFVFLDSLTIAITKNVAIKPFEGIAINERLNKSLRQNRKIKKPSQSKIKSDNQRRFMSSDTVNEPKHSKLLKMHLTENFKNNQRANKIKVNMKKMNSACLMKNRFDQIKV